MKLWVDDIRDPPNGWELARSYNEAISMLLESDINEISLDHDLGEEKTGYDIANFIERHVYYGVFDSPKIHIHTSNPVGRKNIQACVDRIKRFEETL
jgi:hypothetical protein